MTRNDYIWNVTTRYGKKFKVISKAENIGEFEQHLENQEWIQTVEIHHPKVVRCKQKLRTRDISEFAPEINIQESNTLTLEEESNE